MELMNRKNNPQQIKKKEKRKKGRREGRKKQWFDDRGTLQ